MKVLDQTHVSPPPGSVPESALPLTFFDLTWLDHAPVQRCFFYHLPYSSTSQLVQSHIPSLQTSLSLTLQHFYPLVAKLVQSPHSDERFELRYSENNSVPFTVVETDGDFLDLTGCHPRDFSKLESLLPEMGDSLLAVQITVLPNQGICIGVSVHHVACDGFSYVHFMKTWAATCRSDLSVPLPSFDRTAPATLDEFCSIMIKARPQIKSMQVKKNVAQNQIDDYVSATIKLGSEHIKRLKQLVHSSFHTSTFVLTCAYLLICSLKLRKIGADQTVCFPIAVDWRQRLQPRAPEWYFGNCVFFSMVFLNAGDILKDNGLTVASEGIGEAIDELKEGIGKTFARARSWSSASVTGPALTIAGSPRLRVYETDFGWGKPVKVEIVSIKNEGVALAESRDDPGGVEIGVVLPKQEMEEFTAIFNEGLDLLGR